ncbi:hypothetical protein GOBAR_AA08739 [Gossypium barbadense]|uniref:Pentacotripeptide-repeat region of PRORP domain-containing protein n=1 Tax=Gossypium barbadense TaxID=3634 RepID=A0A2P5Y8K1_GOSBA|nr:hypothetical protein GOBAR_AA08739 [Gossypium barbadense]
MSTKNLVKIFEKSLPRCPKEIAEVLVKSGLKPFKTNPSLISGLNSNTTDLVLSNPNLPIHSCTLFFNFLRTNLSLTPQKPNLQTHLSFIRRLHKAGNFEEIKQVLKFILSDDNLRYPVEEILSLFDFEFDNSYFLNKLSDFLFRVCVDNKRFEEANLVFDYMKKMGFNIDERSCILYLVALKKSDKGDSFLLFFRRMVESGVEIGAYSMTIVIDGLCRRGEVEKGRELMNEMASKGVKANVVTYNTILNAYVLMLMEREEVEYNAATYTVLIEHFGNIGKHDEVEKLFDEMRERKVEMDVHLYTSMILRGNIKKAVSLFDELTEKGLVPNARVYGALIDGLCKTGQMEAAQLLLKDMQSQKIVVNQVIINTLLHGYCRKGMMDDALRLVAVMEKKGFKPDVFTYNIMASGMSRLKRYEEAKRWLFMMVENQLTPNAINFTTLIDIHCKEGNIVEAKRLFRQLQGKGESPNTVTYNALIDGYGKKGEMKDAYKLRDEMEAKGRIPDVYTYTSLVHGECSFGNIDEAMKLFNKMRQKGLVPNIVTYTAIISGLSKKGRSDEAFRLYNEMISLGHVPDQRVYSSLVGSLHTT